MSVFRCCRIYLANIGIAIVSETPHTALQCTWARDFDVEELQAKGRSDETRGKEVRDRPSVFGDLG